MIPLATTLRLAPYAAAGAALLASLWWVDHRAYRSGQAACEAAHAAEAARQAEAVQRAQYGAAQRVAAIEEARRAAEAKARRITDAAMDLGGDCLPADLVRQLDDVGRR